ncbi:hypothetical protein [Dictyobacter kobayashii]|uniref:DUF3021 domain-containing protein n=1 Tax=Dictyobacter kobayashii TaxID=2014872 RepID=A0A402AUA8_9CHLR|nr:hypothetical protein [Dictyobacter kobayashii]GCE22702.1 hypothetical protein KDK_65020 [Dictyobacter kobayashii]
MSTKVRANLSGALYSLTLVLLAIITTLIALYISNRNFNNTLINVSAFAGAIIATVIHTFLWLFAILSPRKPTRPRGILIGLGTGLLIYPIATSTLAIAFSHQGNLATWVWIALLMMLSSGWLIAALYTIADYIMVSRLQRLMENIQSSADTQADAEEHETPIN